MAAKKKPICSLVVALLIISTILITISSCGKEDEFNLNDQYLETLADTVWADQTRWFFSATGTGGWYLEQTERSQKRSCVGFYYKEKKMLAGFSLQSQNREPLLDDLDYVVNSPTEISRHYLSGLKETTELPWMRNGIMISFESKSLSRSTFRPWFDIRAFDEESSPEYDWEYNDLNGALTVKLKGVEGEVCVFMPVDRTEFIPDPKYQRVSHPSSYKRGRIYETSQFSAGEFVIGKARRARFICSWGQSEAEALDENLKIQEEMEVWRDLRRSEYVWILSNPALKCEPAASEKAFAWARICGRQLIYEEDGKPWLFAGLPYHPCPAAMHTFLSLPGMEYVAPQFISDLFKTFVHAGDTVRTSRKFGMIPTEYRSGGFEWRHTELAGLAVRALENCNSLDQLSDAEYDRVVRSVLANVAGTSRIRTERGMVVSQPGDDLLADSEIAPERSGALIENQVLNALCRDFVLKAMQKKDSVDYLHGVPASIVKGTGTTVLSSEIPIIAIGKAGEHKMPLSRNLVLYPFADRKTSWFYDGLKTEGLEELRIDSTIRVSQLLAYYWYKGNDTRAFKRMTGVLDQFEMAGDAGLRSLSPSDPEFSRQREYLPHEGSAGSASYGDVLLWTGGVLVDIYLGAGKGVAFEMLASSIEERVLRQGVTGCMGESENAVQQVELEHNLTGDIINSTATFEYIRLVSETLIGLPSKPESILKLKPRFPQGWGAVTISFKFGDATIKLSRTDNFNYSVLQVGKKPYIDISMEVYPEPAKRALASARLYPEDEKIISFVVKGGRWIGRSGDPE